MIRTVSQKVANVYGYFEVRCAQIQLWCWHCAPYKCSYYYYYYYICNKYIATECDVV